MWTLRIFPAHPRAPLCWGDAASAIQIMRKNLEREDAVTSALWRLEHSLIGTARSIGNLLLRRIGRWSLAQSSGSAYSRPGSEVMSRSAQCNSSATGSFVAQLLAGIFSETRSPIHRFSAAAVATLFSVRAQYSKQRWMHRMDRA